MEPTELSTLHITGLSCDTDSERQLADIGALWGRAVAAGAVRPGEDAWAVYHRYEVRGQQFRVRVTVGRRAEVAGADEELVQVPPQRYLKWVTDGTVAEVQLVWGDVWRRPLARGFVADLERWRFTDDGRPSVAEVFVGLKAE